MATSDPFGGRYPLCSSGSTPSSSGSLGATAQPDLLAAPSEALANMEEQQLVSTVARLTNFYKAGTVRNSHEACTHHTYTYTCAHVHTHRSHSTYAHSTRTQHTQSKHAEQARTDSTLHTVLTHSTQSTRTAHIPSAHTHSTRSTHMRIKYSHSTRTAHAHSTHAQHARTHNACMHTCTAHK